MYICLLVIWISVLFGNVSYSEKVMQKVVASDGNSSDYFARSVSIYNDTAIVGATDEYGTDNGKTGSAYVFSKVNGTWIQTQKLTPYNATGYDTFGYSVCVYGNDAMIGSKTPNRGVYVFAKTDGEWVFSQKLFPNNASSNEYFGFKLSIYNTTAIIGTYLPDDYEKGRSYVFVKENGIWSQQATLTNDLYKTSVDMEVTIYGEWYLTAHESPQYAYMYKRTNGIWSLNQILSANDRGFVDYFGASVGMYGDYALVGAPYNDDDGSNSGCVYVFELSDGVWTQTNKLTASDAASGDTFGWNAVSVYDKYTVIGSPSDDDDGSISGSVYWELVQMMAYLPDYY